MRCASAGTWTVSGLTPAALWTSRVDGPESAAAASRAHDSSGLRSFPSTPAPAIWVVGVTSERADDPLGPDGDDPQPLHVTTRTVAAAMAATNSRVGGLRGSGSPLDRTDPTLSSGQLATCLLNRFAARVEAFTTVCRTSPASPLLGG